MSSELDRLLADNPQPTRSAGLLRRTGQHVLVGVCGVVIAYIVLKVAFAVAWAAVHFIITLVVIGAICSLLLWIGRKLF